MFSNKKYHLICSSYIEQQSVRPSYRSVITPISVLSGSRAMSEEKKKLSLEGQALGLFAKQPAYNHASKRPFTLRSWIKHTPVARGETCRTSEPAGRAPDRTVGKPDG